MDLIEEFKTPDISPTNDYNESSYKNPMKRYQRKSRASRKSESRSRV